MQEPLGLAIPGGYLQREVGGKQWGERRASSSAVASGCCPEEVGGRQWCGSRGFGFSCNQWVLSGESGQAMQGL